MQRRHLLRQVFDPEDEVGHDVIGQFVYQMIPGVHFSSVPCLLDLVKRGACTEALTRFVRRYPTKSILHEKLIHLLLSSEELARWMHATFPFDAVKTNLPRMVVISNVAHKREDLDAVTKFILETYYADRDDVIWGSVMKQAMIVNNNSMLRWMFEHLGDDYDHDMRVHSKFVLTYKHNYEEGYKALLKEFTLAHSEPDRLDTFETIFQCLKHIDKIDKMGFSPEFMAILAAHLHKYKKGTIVRWLLRHTTTFRFNIYNVRLQTLEVFARHLRPETFIDAMQRSYDSVLGDEVIKYLFGDQPHADVKFKGVPMITRKFLIQPVIQHIDRDVIYQKFTRLVMNQQYWMAEAMLSFYDPAFADMLTIDQTREILEHGRDLHIVKSSGHMQRLDEIHVNTSLPAWKYIVSAESNAYKVLEYCFQQGIKVNDRTPGQPTLLKMYKNKPFVCSLLIKCGYMVGLYEVSEEDIVSLSMPVS